MKNKQLQFISQLSSYEIKKVIFRLITVSGVAVLFMFTADLLVAKNVIIPISVYTKVVLIFILISESNVLLDHIAERYMPIPSKVVMRIFSHFFLSLIIGIIAVIIFQHQLKEIDLMNLPITWLMFAFGFIFVFIFIVVVISLRITAKWLSSQREVEELKQMQLINDYNALQDQLNPHFLFNNLSVLKSMIKYDQNAAIEFTQNFTDTYRYVLQNNEKTLVSLSQEMEFIHSYINLHKERHGDGLKVEYNIDETLMNKRIPPLSLQLLVENALKHNIANKEEPLYIKIYTQNDFIIIENNVQLKESTYSTYKGLKNLKDRYTMLSEKEVIIYKDDNIFKVELPLL